MPRIRLLIGAAALLGASVAPVAFGNSDDRNARASASVKKQVSKLKRQVAELQQQVQDVSKQTGPQGPKGEQGPPGPVSSAGGDLNGTYPNPTIAAGAVGSTEIEDGSVAGVDVDESSLATVPTAGDAGTLDGLDSFVFERKTRIAFGGAQGNVTGDQVILSGGSSTNTFDVLNDGDVDESTEVRIRSTGSASLHVSSPTTTTTVSGNTTSGQIDASAGLVINPAVNVSIAMLLDCRVDRTIASDAVLCFGTRSSAP